MCAWQIPIHDPPQNKTVVEGLEGETELINHYDDCYGPSAAAHEALIHLTEVHFEQLPFQQIPHTRSLLAGQTCQSG